MPLVFAFGSNMDPKQMRQRCRSATFRGVYDLAGHRLAFVGRSAGWGGAVATIEKCAGAMTTGVLWEVSRADLDILDRFEGAPHVYSRVAARVRQGAQRGADLWVYVHNRPEARGQPSTAYVETIRRGFAFIGRAPQRLDEAVTRAGGLAIPPDELAGLLERARSRPARAV
jgi:cation transport regulator ChaC